MSLWSEIAAPWRGPRAAIRARLTEGLREDRTLARLAGGCLALFLAQWPGILRAGALNPAIPPEARVGGAALGTLLIAPLGFYALAALSGLALRLAGRPGGSYLARLALFSALLAVSPLVLGQGIVAGIAGPGVVTTATGIAVWTAFLWLWLAGLGAAMDERA
ncbi:YIP1 family protein [Frigidibacter sp. MR17.24]|uniref:YIP1 family protein n=1 Tax=Frigidibacter sp. MR17.24 TaxID=3127345 RepID=UPI003012C62E